PQAADGPDEAPCLDRRAPGLADVADLPPVPEGESEQEERDDGVREDHGRVVTRRCARRYVEDDPLLSTRTFALVTAPRKSGTRMERRGTQRLESPDREAARTRGRKGSEDRRKGLNSS